MEKGRREEGPEDVDDEGETAGHVQREAVVFVSGDFGTCSRDGFGGAVGAC